MQLSPEQIARVCHEANRGLQAAVPNPANAVNPPWDELLSALQDSAIAGVAAALAGSTPEQMHEQWSTFKRAQGYVFGPMKDETAKTHPCLIPYSELPEAERKKDRLFLAVVGALTQ